MNIGDMGIVVTGGARGIGLGLVQHLARLGAGVVVNDTGVELNGEPGDPYLADRIAEEIRSEGHSAVASSDSVAEPDSGRRLVEFAMTEFGRLDAWVNCATITSDRMIFKMSDEEWTRVVDVDLNGSFYTMRAALAHMREQHSGRLVNLVSTAGLIGNFGQANYAASKGGTVAMSRVAALEMQRYGVTVNCVAPFAHTRMTDSIPGKTPEQQAYLEKARKAKVEHILPLLEYLVSSRSEGISGQVFGVRGCEVFLFSQPEPIKTISQPGGWTQEALAQALDMELKPALTPLRTDLEMFQSEPLT